MFTLQGDTVIGRSLRIYGEFAGDEVDSIANVTLNQLTTVACLRAAVGAAPGSCAVPRLDPMTPHNAGATAVSLDPCADGPTDIVPVLTVDSLALTRCDLIKIDTEGFEDLVVQGALQTLQTHRPALYVEVHDRDKLRLLHARLKPLGYSMTLHSTRFFRPSNPRGEAVNVFSPNAGGSALIALPPGRTLPTPLPGDLRPLS